MKAARRAGPWVLCIACCVGGAFAAPPVRPPLVRIPDLVDGPEAERVVAASRGLPLERRLAFVSACFLGRPYSPGTKARVKKQRAPGEGHEARNRHRLPVEVLPTSLRYLDCMTYVEHVLALCAAGRPDYRGAFLPRLVDLMHDAGGGPLYNDTRNHFMTAWAVANERKGYVRDVTRSFPSAVERTVTLNRVGLNGTKYVEDRFMKAKGPTTFAYVPVAEVLAGRALPLPGDVVCLAGKIEGLDVNHVGFVVARPDGTLGFRHASYKLNKVVDDSLAGYLGGSSATVGLVVLRPVLEAPEPPAYRFAPAASAEGR